MFHDAIPRSLRSIARSAPLWGVAMASALLWSLPPSKSLAATSKTHAVSSSKTNAVTTQPPRQAKLKASKATSRPRFIQASAEPSYPRDLDVRIEDIQPGEKPGDILITFVGSDGKKSQGNLTYGGNPSSNGKSGQSVQKSQIAQAVKSKRASLILVKHSNAR